MTQMAGTSGDATRIRQKADDLFTRANAADTACDHDLANMLFQRASMLCAEADRLDAVDAVSASA